MADSICYIQPDHRTLDGAEIYDRRLKNALISLGCQVEVIKVDCRRDIALTRPLWGSAVPHQGCAARLRAKSAAATFTIVSHEKLWALADVVKPDLFIVHNLFSSFRFAGRPDVEWLYRLNSVRAYRSIFNASVAALFLSAREQRIAEEMYGGGRFFFVPPGASGSAPKVTASRDTEVIYLADVSAWRPKRLSVMSDRELGGLRSLGVRDCIRGGGGESSPSLFLIEDRFISGFKLKLIDAFERGHGVISVVDLREDVASLNLDCVDYVFAATGDDLRRAIVDARTTMNKDVESLRRAQTEIRARLSWSWVARSIVDILHGDSGIGA